MLISRSQTKPIPLVLPRITNESMTIVRPKSREECIVNFSSIIETANRKEISLVEAMKDIATEHKVDNCIAVVHQAMFYENTEYRDAVLESISDIKMQYVDAGTDQWFDDALNEAIKVDIKNRNTTSLDTLLEFSIFGTNNTTDTTKQDINNRINGTSELDEYQKGVKFGFNVARALGKMRNLFKSLTNSNTINHASPGLATRMINSLHKMLNIITGKAQQSPPETQGVFSKIITRIKEAIKALGRKVGLVK